MKSFFEDPLKTKIPQDFKDPHSTLLFGDCLERMKEIPQQTIHFICCDLPYGTTAPEWDTQIPIQPLWKEYTRILHPQGTIALFASQPFTTQLIQSNLKQFKYCWYWLKNQGTNFFHAKRMPIRKVEEVCVFHSGLYIPQITKEHTPTQSAKGCSNGKAYHGSNKRNYEGGKTTRYPINLLTFDCVNNYQRLHSAEKPTPLIEYLIKTYTNPQEKVLDNCMGSGTTGVAAKNTHRKFIGIEMDPYYYNMAQQRIQNTL